MKLFINSFLKDLRNAYSYKLNFIFSFFSIFVILFIFFNISKIASSSDLMDKYNNNYFLFIVIGLAITELSFFIAKAIPNEIRNGQMSGLLEELAVSNKSFFIILYSHVMYPILYSFIRTCIYMIVIFYLIEDFSLNIIIIIICLLTYILTILIFSSLGIIAASYVLVFKKGDPINAIYFSLASIFSGVLYPLETLPSWGKI